MWRFCLLILICGYSITSVAQEHYCATEATPEQLIYMDSIHSLAVKSSRRMNSPVSVPLQFHILRRSDGTGGLDPNRIASLITEVNLVYQGAGISFFQPRPTNFIDNDQWFNFDSSEEAALASSRDVPNVINIYIPGTVRSGSSNVCGYAYFPPSPDRLFVALGCADSEFSTTAHEIGHYFDLFHTHGKTNTGTTDELVQRINCDILGDNLCDTEADPNLSGRVSGCTYTGNVTDANGDQFKPNVRNIMSYAPRNCRNLFTNGQLGRMRDALDFARSNLNVIFPNFNARFSSDIRSGCAPLKVNFFDESAGSTDREWEFSNGNGEVITSSIENPQITFQSSGDYDVRLIVKNNNGEEKETFRKGYLIVNDLYEKVQQDTIFNKVNDLTLPVNWRIINYDQLESFVITDASADDTGGSLSLQNFSYEPQVLPAVDDVELSNYNFEEVKSFRFEFEYAYTYRAGNVTGGIFPTYDSLAVGYKVNCDDDFKQMLKLGGDQLKTSPATNQSFVPQPNEWKTLSVEINKEDLLSSVNVVRPVIRNINRNGNNLYLDNFQLIPDFSVDSLQFFRLAGQNDKSISFRWQNPAINETGVKIERSINGENFTIIAELPKNANMYTDENIPEDTEIIYYRAANFNSQAVSGYTPILIVTKTITSLSFEKNNNDDLILYPNPTDRKFVNLSGDLVATKSIQTFKIYSSIDKLLNIFESNDVVYYNNTVEIPLQGMKKGLYILQISGSNINSKFKLLIE